MAKEIYYWEAEDGKKFPTEDECVFYEKCQKAKRLDGQFKLFDDFGEETPFYDAGPDEVFGIMIKTQEAADFLADWFKDAYWKPWSRPEDAKPGNYIFINEEWWREEGLRKFIEEKLEIFKKRG